MALSPELRALVKGSNNNRLADRLDETAGSLLDEACQHEELAKAKRYAAELLWEEAAQLAQASATEHPENLATSLSGRQLTPA